MYELQRSKHPQRRRLKNRKRWENFPIGGGQGAPKKSQFQIGNSENPEPIQKRKRTTHNLPIFNVIMFSNSKMSEFDPRGGGQQLNKISEIKMKSKLSGEGGEVKSNWVFFQMFPFFNYDASPQLCSGQNDQSRTRRPKDDQSQTFI